MLPGDVFSNRELAAGAWVIAFFGWALTKREIRSSLGQLVWSALAWRLSLPAVLLASYLALVCHTLRRFGFWDIAMLKDTILWFVVSGLAFAFSFDRSTKRGWLRSAVTDQLGIIVLLEYLATAYTFSLPTELALQPVLVAVGVLHAASENEIRYRPVRRVTGAVLILAGLGIFTNAIYQASQAIGGTSHTVRSIFLPAVLAIAFLPAAYCLHLAAAYERLFIGLRLGGPRDVTVIRYAKRQLIKELRLDVRRIREFLTEEPMALSRVRTKQDVDILVSHHRRLNRRSLAQQ